MSVTSMDEAKEDTNSLEGRRAECSYRAGRDGKPCTTERASTESKEGRLAFFKHRPEQATDSFYCGCWGWD